MTLKNISIGKRLALALGTLLLLCFASSLFAIAQLRRMSAEVQRLVVQQRATGPQRRADALMPRTDQDALLERIARRRHLELVMQGPVFRHGSADGAPAVPGECAQNFGLASQACMDIDQVLARQQQQRQRDASASQVGALSAQSRLMLVIAAASALGLALLLTQRSGKPA